MNVAHGVMWTGMANDRTGLRQTGRVRSTPIHKHEEIHKHVERLKQKKKKKKSLLAEPRRPLLVPRGHDLHTDSVNAARST